MHWSQLFNLTSNRLVFPSRLGKIFICSSVLSFFVWEDGSPSYMQNNPIFSSFIILFCQVLAYYISFLKTLSLKLNRHTVHFFFNEVSDHLNLFNSQAWNKCNKLIFNSKSIIFSLKDRPTKQIDCSSAPNVLPLFLEKEKWMEKSSN